jgi:hypothetical protein
MLTTAQNELLQQFLTMPDPKYAQIFEAQAERDELADEVESLKSDNEGLTDDLQDAEMKADDDLARIRELEAALADALSWIAGDSIPSDLAETDKAFCRLYKVL